MAIIILFISGILAVLLALHWAVYLTIGYFLHFKPDWLLWLFLAMPVGFVAASVVASRFNNWLTNIFYYTTAAWLGLFNFVAIAAILMWLLYGLSKLFHFNLAWPQLMLALLGLAVIVCCYGIINAYWLRVKIYEVSLPNLPASWQNRTAVWVSDLHLGQIHQAKFSQRVVDKIKALEPDIVFVGGDLFDGTAGNLEKLAEPFRQLKPALGTYFITGNHEEFANPEQYLSAVKDLGMTVLANESVDADGVFIAGVNFRDGAHHARFEKTVSAIGFHIGNSITHERFKDAFAQLHLKPDQPIILLNHYPGNLDIASDAGVGLQLSGHSHGGQLWPYHYITSLVYHGYDLGLHTYKKMNVITSAGVGTWGPPLRVAADPDIIVIKFKNNN